MGFGFILGMKVCSNYIYAKQSHYSAPVERNTAAKNVSFSGGQLNNNEKLVFDSYINRDPRTLDQVTEYLQKTFRQGGDCVFYGDPFGYEAQGILFRLPDNSNFKMTSFEFTKEAFNLRHEKGLPLFAKFNPILLAQNLEDSIAKRIQQKYYENFNIERHSQKDAFGFDTFLVPKKNIPEIDYMPPQLSDIRDMPYFCPDNAKCLFFRNSFFNLHKKHVIKMLQDEKPFNELTFSKFIPNQAEFDEMINSFKQIAKNANKKLDINGLFVLGDIPQDHMFISPNNEKTMETAKLKDFAYIEKYFTKPERMGIKTNSMIKAENINVLIKSPLEKILLENGFEEYLQSSIRDSQQIVTTIFRKVRNI